MEPDADGDFRRLPILPVTVKALPQVQFTFTWIRQAAKFDYFDS